MKKEFPENFLWGSSISAYQAEGAITEDGKALSVADLSTCKNGICQNAVSSDFYHHYKDDIKLLAEMGAKTFRFSLSWPRIMPQGEGELNFKGIEFYNHVLDELEKYHITPIVTLFHYDLPLPLFEKYGGWKNRKVVDLFLNFCKVCFQEFGDRIHYYLTINEPDILLMYGGHGLDLGGEEDFQKHKLIINHHFAIAHAKAVNLCHEMLPKVKIGPVFGYVPVYPRTSNPLDMMAANKISDIQNSFFQELFLNGFYMENVLNMYSRKSEMPIIIKGDMELIKNAKSDIIALNYYKSDVAYSSNTDQGYQLIANQYTKQTKWGWDIDSIGIRYMLHDVYYRYHMPILITENGIAEIEEIGSDSLVEDLYRIDFLRSHLLECKKAIDDGVELIGYCNWSYLDLISTSHGFEKRYGLIYIDEKNNNKRIPKSSYFWYKDIIKTNGGKL